MKTLEEKRTSQSRYYTKWYERNKKRISEKRKLQRQEGVDYYGKNRDKINAKRREQYRLRKTVTLIPNDSNNS